MHGADTRRLGHERHDFLSPEFRVSRRNPAAGHRHSANSEGQVVFSRRISRCYRGGSTSALEGASSDLRISYSMTAEAEERDKADGAHLRDEPVPLRAGLSLAGFTLRLQGDALVIQFVHLIQPFVHLVVSFREF